MTARVPVDECNADSGDSACDDGQERRLRGVKGAGLESSIKKAVAKAAAKGL